MFFILTPSFSTSLNGFQYVVVYSGLVLDLWIDTDIGHKKKRPDTTEGHVPSPSCPGYVNYHYYGQ